MVLVLLVLWALPHLTHGYHLSYAFWCACVVSFLDMCSGIMCVAEFIRRKQEESPRWRDSPVGIEPDDEPGPDTEML